VALLESDPAFQNLHDRGHFGELELHGQISGLGDIAESVFVAALAAKTAAHPEICDGDHLFVADFVFEGEDGVEVFDGLGEFFFGHGDEAVDHAQVGVLEESESFGGSIGEMGQELF